jgi:hypothetical protein
MAPRSDLHDILVALLGSNNVYFQPPPTVKMVYPCTKTDFAMNKPYLRQKRYLVTVIDPNPDSIIPDKVAQLPKCIFDRFYTADTLNHDVYKLFF